MKWLDIPPVWLIACIYVTYASVEVLPRLPVLGGLVVFAGLALMALALFEMRQHRTTPIPHMEADALVTSGIFAYSRNPIYLGDLLVLAGLSLLWGTSVGFLLVPLLAFILQRRFILPEEARLRAKFGEDFEYYCTQTRRWL